jgi:hypothetical protein
MNVLIDMTKFLLFFTFLVVLQACQKNPSIPESDPIFQEKKRPPYNDAMISKVQTREHDADYQEVNPNFANDYQDVQRDFRSKSSDDTLIQQPKSNQNYDPLTIQKIRDDANKIQNANPYSQSQKQDYEHDNTDYTLTPNQSTQLSNSAQENSPGSEGIYEIQAGSYQSDVGARAIVQKLENAQVKNVRIEKINGINVIRITGEKPFNDRAEASKYLQKIIEKSQHYDIMVVKK